MQTVFFRYSIFSLGKRISYINIIDFTSEKSEQESEDNWDKNTKTINDRGSNGDKIESALESLTILSQKLTHKYSQKILTALALIRLEKLPQAAKAKIRVV